MRRCGEIVLEGDEVAFNNTRQLDIGGDAGGTKFTLNRRHDRFEAISPRQLRTVVTGVQGSYVFLSFSVVATRSAERWTLGL